MHIHSYNKHITITYIINYMHSYHGLIQVLMLIRISRRSCRAYSYIKVPVGTTQVHYTEVPVGTTGLILILQDLYLFESPIGVTELTRIQEYP